MARAQNVRVYYRPAYDNKYIELKGLTYYRCNIPANTEQTELSLRIRYTTGYEKEQFEILRKFEEKNELCDWNFHYSLDGEISECINFKGKPHVVLHLEVGEPLCYTVEVTGIKREIIRKIMQEFMIRRDDER